MTLRFRTYKKETKAHKESNKQWRHRRRVARREAAIKQLGGKCVRCGSEDNLEIDHIDPKTKTYKMHVLMYYTEATWQQELAKCQLLCISCHTKKSHEDRLELDRSRPR